jgi:hypothetical protein
MKFVKRALSIVWVQCTLGFAVAMVGVPVGLCWIAGGNVYTLP